MRFEKPFTKWLEDKLENNYYCEDLPALSKTKQHLVFMYGTFKRGFKRGDMLAGEKFIGNAVTLSDQYQMYNHRTKSQRFPVILPTGITHPMKARISGEVYLVDTELMPVLDQIEANGLMYDRQKITVKLTNKVSPKGPIIFPAWAYIGIVKTWSSNLDKPFCQSMVPFTRNANDYKYYMYTQKDT